jgi:hypothetical protein
MIASVLIITMITAGLVGVRQVNLLTQVGATRTTHSEIRARIVEALSQFGACADQLEHPKLPGPFAVPAPPVGHPIPRILEALPGGGFAPRPIIDSADPERGGLKYEISLQFPYPSAVDFPEPVPRAGGPLYRYQLELQVKGLRTTLGTQLNDGAGSTAPNSANDLYARIPLTADFDANGLMVSCAVLAEDVDQVLANGTHTVRDCLAIDGIPMPTEFGLVCRVPVPLAVSTRETGTIPVAQTCKPGWTPFRGTNGIVFNTTAATDFERIKCKNRKIRFYTGWHAFSPTDPADEKVYTEIQKGTKRFTVGSFAIAAAATALFGLLGLAAFLLIFFLRCPKEDVWDFPQVTSVGCV